MLDPGRPIREADIGGMGQEEDPLEVAQWYGPCFPMPPAFQTQKFELAVQGRLRGGTTFGLTIQRCRDSTRRVK